MFKVFKVFKSPIKIKTPDGYKTAYGIRKIQKEGIRISFSKDSYIETSLNHKFVENGNITRSKNIKTGDLLQGRIVDDIKNIGVIDVYDLTDVDGKLYYTNDLVSHNCVFLGSSDTLVSGDSLREIGNHIEKVEVIPTNIMYGLTCYKTVEKGHTYIVSVDPSKDGIDKFSVNVIDISQFPFEQVAVADLDIDYLVMPEHLSDLGKYYNEAMIIVEGNEGAGQSITDTLFGVYEYPSLYRDKNINNKPGYKKYTGFRTTTKSRPIILNLMKIFIEEGKLIINSTKTLEQMYTFTKKKTGLKYQAEDGYFDDLIMSLAISFAPFMDSKSFDSYEFFTKELRREDSELRTSVYLSTMDFGFTSEEDDEYINNLKTQRDIIGENTDYFPSGETISY